MDDVYNARPGTENRPRSTTRKEPALGPRQPDSAICAGCGDGVAQSIGNFPVILGGGRSPLCKLHQPEAWPAVVQAWREATPEQPFVATDEDIDFLDAITDPNRPQRVEPRNRVAYDGPEARRVDLVTVYHDGPDAAIGIVMDPGYAPSPAAHLMRSERGTAASGPFAAEATVPPAPVQPESYMQSVALEAVPVPAGTLERLTRNANADRMVAALSTAVHRLEALPARVTSDEEQGTVAALILSAAEEERNIEALRVKLKAPFAAAVATIDGAMGASSGTRKLLGVLRVRMGKALGAYQDHRGATAAREAEEAILRATQAAEAEAAAMARAASATTEDDRHRAMAEADAASLAQVHATMDAQDAQQPVKGVKTEAGTLGFTQPWGVEVVDPDRVPRVWLVVDMVKLRAAVRAGVREVPGCVISQGHGLRMGR